jgi:tRNA-specific 2-thiouridylase
MAMSGGVDSSVAAALLVRDGYEVVGCFMRLGSPGEDLDGAQIGHKGCCSINDAADARLVAARLDIPFYVCNFKKEFGRIIDYFVGAYNDGLTPNPCVRCNDWLKFGKLHAYARQIGARYVASGHYARVRDGALLRGVDHGKDQSYVLFGTPRDRIDEMLLPIGEYHKTKVRELAEQFGLPVFDKPDSQEICFVPDDDYAGLVERHGDEGFEPGSIIDRDGSTIGTHQGHQHFTVGQRRGVGVALGYPIYVVEKNAAANTVTVGPREDLLANGCAAAETNWLCEPDPDTWTRCGAQIRYNADPVPARVRSTGPRQLEVRFDEPQFAVAPGQAVVCYDGDRVLGGGWISEARRHEAV